jgi:polysaccharide pyruvyl transferase WcaK-like protein
MQSLRIALFGLFGVGNLGNDGSLLAMVDQIKQRLPDAKISCICPEPKKISKEFEIQTVSIDMDPLNYKSNSISWKIKIIYKIMRNLKIPNELISWFRILGYLKNVDVMIIPGTGIMDDFGVTPFQMPYDLFKWCFLAKICRKRIFFVSIGAGPIEKTISRWFFKFAANVADYRSYRDQFSKDFMESIGIQIHRDKVYPDIVFSLDVANFNKEKNDNKLEKLITIGIGVMAYYGWRDRPAIGGKIYKIYVNKIAHFILNLINQNFCVRLLIGDTNYDQRAVIDILNKVREHEATLTEKYVIYEPIHSLNELFYQISMTDIVVATRFHNIVCSLMLNKPVISIGYAKKFKVLLDEVDLEEYDQHIEGVDINLLNTLIKKILKDREILEKHIMKKIYEIKMKLCEQNEIIYFNLKKLYTR